MKILFDSQIFDAQKYGGISRYFTELCRYFDSAEDVGYEIPIKSTNNEYLRGFKSSLKKGVLSSYFFSKGNSIFQKIFYKIYGFFNKNNNRNRAIKAIKSQDFDIFHPTYYSTYFLKHLKNKLLVVTVYDMIYEIYPEYFPSDAGRVIANKKKLIERADKIIAISHHTKKDIIRFYQVPEDKIEVIHLGNSLEPVHKTPISAPEIPDKYILFVGSRGGYKNFDFFIRSISPILQNDKNMHVVVAGGYARDNTFSSQEKKIFDELHIEKQIVQCSMSDTVLSYLYQNALCFVFPTLYEGFGIPILEAFACGCPAVLSNTSSLPEVGGSAAIYFDPTNSASILESVQEVIQNKSLRDTMILEGKQQLKKFSWSKTAQETLSVYANLL